MIEEKSLAHRLGVTTHLSSFHYRLKRLMAEYPVIGVEEVEDWLLYLSNARGIDVVRPMVALDHDTTFPSLEEFSNEELVVALCQPQHRDRPQWLRLVSQIVTRGKCDLEKLSFLARRERVERILGGIAEQALVVEPNHAGWKTLVSLSEGFPPLRDSLLHWSRLTKPVMGKPGEKPDRELVG